MIGRPLAQQFGSRARVLDLVSSSPGEMVSGNVANAIAGSLDGVHANIGQGIQHVRHILQQRPVELDILAGGKMAVALVPFVGDVSELAHFGRIEGTIGNGDPQHIGMKLQIKAVHQAQGLELVLGQRAVQTLFDLTAKLAYPFANKFSSQIHCRYTSVFSCSADIGLFAVKIVGRAAGAEGLAKMGRFGNAVFIDDHIGEIGTDDDFLLGLGVFQHCMRLLVRIGDMGILMEARPGSSFGQINGISEKKIIGSDDLRGKFAGHFMRLLFSDG